MKMLTTTAKHKSGWRLGFRYSVKSWIYSPNRNNKFLHSIPTFVHEYIAIGPLVGLFMVIYGPRSKTEWHGVMSEQ